MVVEHILGYPLLLVCMLYWVCWYVMRAQYSDFSFSGGGVVVVVWGL